MGFFVPGAGAGAVPVPGNAFTGQRLYLRTTLSPLLRLKARLPPLYQALNILAVTEDHDRSYYA